MNIKDNILTVVKCIPDVYARLSGREGNNFTIVFLVASNVANYIKAKVHLHYS